MPVLWFKDVQVNQQIFDQSLDIMLWAMEQNDPLGLFRLCHDEKQQAHALIAQLDGPFKYHLDRYKYSNRYDNCDPCVHRVACVDVIKKWDYKLQGQLYLFGDQVKYADFAILPFVRQMRIANPDWFDQQKDFPNVQQWLQRFLKSLLFEQCMLKVDVWVPGQAVVYFPK